VIKSNSDYHAQKQKDYRFSSRLIYGMSDFLYFSVLALISSYPPYKELQLNPLQKIAYFPKQLLCKNDFRIY